MRIRWRGLEPPNRVVSDRGTLTDTYGRFSAEPFERGFGVTVGNSLRRILLSSLEGSAVTQVKIQGVQHEISTIPGVVEDVTDIILNIKSLVVKNSCEQPRTIKIDRHDRGVVTAAHIITDEAIQIVNREHIIATVTDDVPFVVEMTVEDRGEMAGGGEAVDHDLERKLNMSLAELELSVRATNCLESEGITTVRDLVIRNDEELLEVRNFGETTLKEVKIKLQERGLSLGMKLPSQLRR